MDLTSFHRDCHITIENYISTDLLKTLLAALNSYSEGNRTASNQVYAKRNILNEKNICSFCGSSSIRNLIHKIEPRAKAVRAIFFDKPPGANWSVIWHSDQTIAVKEKIEVVGYGPWTLKAGVAHVQPPD